MIDPAFLLTALIVCLVPGTGVVYVLATTLAQGRRAGLFAALGCTLGPLPHLLAAILGVAAILHTSALLYTGMKWAGVAYLLYLGLSALRGGGALNIQPIAEHLPVKRIVLRGLLLNVLNPKLSIFFLALLPPFLSGNPATATAEMIGLGMIFVAVTFATFVLYALFAAAARDTVLRSERAMAWINRAVAGAMAALAGRLALERA